MNRVPFYFMRHAQTDHNLYRIYDDSHDVHLNETGKDQARQLQKILQPLQITTVCSSPLLRVQQTKKLALENKTYEDIIIDGLRECPGALWKLFLASETRELLEEETQVVDAFLNSTKHALMQALQSTGPLLIIAHGGTYWACTHLLKIATERKIDNCSLVRITPYESDTWKAEPVINA